MSLSIFLTNLGRYVEGALVGCWVKLPVSADKLNAVLEKIGINEQYEEYIITDWETSISGLHNAISEYSSVVALNELAEMLEELSSDDEDKLGAVLEVESCRSVGEIKELIEQLDNFNLLPDIQEDEDLGYYYAEECCCIEIPEHLRSYFDYEAYGRDIRLESTGTFTSYGYLEDNR